MARAHASGKGEFGSSPSALTGYTGAETIAVWASIPAVSSGSNYFQANVQIDPSGVSRGWGITATGNTFTAWGCQVVAQGFFSSGNVLSLNTWHHLAIAYNGSGTFSLYQDGSFVTTITKTPTALNSGDQVQVFNSSITGNCLSADRAI